MDQWAFSFFHYFLVNMSYFKDTRASKIGKGLVGKREHLNFGPETSFFFVFLQYFFFSSFSGAVKEKCEKKRFELWTQYIQILKIPTLTQLLFF